MNWCPLPLTAFTSMPAPNTSSSSCPVWALPPAAVRTQTVKPTKNPMVFPTTTWPLPPMSVPGHSQRARMTRPATMTLWRRWTTVPASTLRVAKVALANRTEPEPSSPGTSMDLAPACCPSCLSRSMPMMSQAMCSMAPSTPTDSMTTSVCAIRAVSRSTTSEPGKRSSDCPTSQGQTPRI